MLVSGPQWRIIISGLAPPLLGTNHFVSPWPLFTNLTSFSFTAITAIKPPVKLKWIERLCLRAAQKDLRSRVAFSGDLNCLNILNGLHVFHSLDAIRPLRLLLASARFPAPTSHRRE